MTSSRMGRAAIQTGSGFTVIEIMVVLVIVTILAMVAYPTYQHAIVSTKRSEGKAALMKTMQQQERYFSSHMRYLAFSAAAIDADTNEKISENIRENIKRFPWFSGESAKTSAYEISAQACKGDIRDCVIVFATPGTSRVDAGFQDKVCGVLSLNSAGEKSASADNCW